MFYVEIVEYGNEEVVKVVEAINEKQAKKVERGMNINLNHEEFFTRIVEE